MNKSMQPLENTIESFPNTYVHDITFDWYAKRLAVSSSDGKIKIYSKLVDSKWKLNYDFRAHDDVVNKVKWAHPDFGSIIATSSFDKTVIIWEEPKINSIFQSQDSPDLIENKPWIVRAKLSDSKEVIEDIKFAPKYKGLLLATASSDGSFRIYEAPDIMNLGSWQIRSSNRVNPNGISAISWSQNNLNPLMLAIGCKDDAQNQKKFSGTTKIPEENMKSLHDDNLLMIYKENEDEWKLLKYMTYPNPLEKKLDYQHKQTVSDVAWGPVLGRSFDVLASCGKEGIFIWYLRYDNNSMNIIKAGKIMEGGDIVVWRVSWNMMGTVLASSDNRRVIKLWKNISDKWECVNTIKEEESEEGNALKENGIQDSKFFVKKI